MMMEVDNKGAEALDKLDSAPKRGAKARFQLTFAAHRSTVHHHSLAVGIIRLRIFFN